MDQRTQPVLSLRDVHAWYGESHVLHGMSFDVHRGECVSLLGRNGAGRTTTLRAILGLVDRRSGSIRVRGTETVGLADYRIARLGFGYCPEERGIFAGLSCEENLFLPPRLAPSAAQARGFSVDELYQLFPNLYERRHSPGTRLSGGEQQMLALARVLRTGADILLLDEISEGLAPVIVQTLGKAIRELKKRGYTVVLVEQNFRFASRLADRLLVVEHGTVVKTLSQHEAGEKMDVLKQLLGV